MHMVSGTSSSSLHSSHSLCGLWASLGMHFDWNTCTEHISYLLLSLLSLSPSLLSPFRGLTFDECERQFLELAETQNQYGVTLYPVMVRGEVQA